MVTPIKVSAPGLHYLPELCALLLSPELLELMGRYGRSDFLRAALVMH